MLTQPVHVSLPSRIGKKTEGHTGDHCRPLSAILSGGIRGGGSLDFDVLKNSISQILDELKTRHKEGSNYDFT